MMAERMLDERVEKRMRASQGGIFLAGTEKGKGTTREMSMFLAETVSGVDLPGETWGSGNTTVGR